MSNLLAYSSCRLQYKVSDGSNELVSSFAHVDWSLGKPVFDATTPDGHELIMQLYARTNQSYKLEFKGAMVLGTIMSQSSASSYSGQRHHPHTLGGEARRLHAQGPGD